jgi:Fic family protein
MIKYNFPESWIRYDPIAISDNLVKAKAAVLSLQQIPYQKRWVDSLQKMELKREVAGTSKIEGADFTEGELEAALKETPEELFTRSQRQARAAHKAYQWLITVSDERPISEELITEMHWLIVKDADDDHCEAGVIRPKDQNVNFGSPKHRGAEGGDECKESFSLLIKAINREYTEHDPLIQALAAHFHFASMHPFMDGNGRTARCLEALMLQRAGLRSTCFISMSNYYYDEKNNYLEVLAESRAKNFDLTPFLNFGLKGIEIQSQRLLSQIQREISKELFMSMAYNLFNRLHKRRGKRVIAERQLQILKILLNADEELTLEEIIEKAEIHYEKLSSPTKALIRDLNHLIGLDAIKFTKSEGEFFFEVILDWPTRITETEFFQKIKDLPKGKVHSFLR